jgi:hypothetical protein
LDELTWKPDWAAARRSFVGWWAGRDLALCITAPKDDPPNDFPAPGPVSLETRWLDPDYKVRLEFHRMSRTYFGGTALPIFDSDVGGPGSLGLFLGCGGTLADETVWYTPRITDPDTHPPLRFDRSTEWWRRHAAMLDAAKKNAQGKYLVGSPDLIENLDTLAQVRGSAEALADLIERPAWALERIEQINQAFFECYDAVTHWTRDEWGGTTFRAFGVWGPGKTAKVQCDLSCMISAEMFREFVVPAMTRQCEWLDYSIYHLDGSDALHHLPALLSIPGLNAIEFTPEIGDVPCGGSPHWYDLYRRIKAGGKSVQAIGVQYDEVLPLLQAVGPEGMMVFTSAPTESAARELLERVGWPT